MSHTCGDCASLGNGCMQTDVNGEVCEFFAPDEETRIGMHAARYAESYIDRDGQYHQLYWGEEE